MSSDNRANRTIRCFAHKKHVRDVTMMAERAAERASRSRFYNTVPRERVEKWYIFSDVAADRHPRVARERLLLQYPKLFRYIFGMYWMYPNI